MRAREALTAASSRPSLWGHQSGRREAHKPAVIGKLGQRRTENSTSSRHERRTIWPSFAGLNPKLGPGTLYVGYRNACLPLAVFDTHSYCTRKSFAVQGRGRVAFETAVTTGDPDPGRAATTEELGRELTLARLRAGLTVRQVAKAAEIPVSTAGDYFAGRHLPSASQSDALRKIVCACGLSTPEQVDAWVLALGRARRVPGRRSADAPVPYRGLAPFEAQDARWFFGRDELVDLLASVAVDSTDGIPVSVTGPSGSGKSSLLRAGLIPRLKSDLNDGKGEWQVAIFTPGRSPMTALRAELSELTGRSVAAVSARLGRAGG